MSLCYFVTFEAADLRPSGIEWRDMAALRDLLRATPGLTEARVHTPGSARDPMLDDGMPPALVLQLYFDSIEKLEAALALDGHLQALPAAPALTTLDAAGVSQQAMLVRRFPVADPVILARDEAQCTYLVAYEGPAMDLNAWLWHYLTGHAPLMAKLPAIRQVEVYTRIDWCGFLPWPRANHMQRNQAVFDSADALGAALQSPLRAQMREHFRHLPPFAGTVTHFPMATYRIEP